MITLGTLLICHVVTLYLRSVDGVREERGREVDSKKFTQMCVLAHYVCLRENSGDKYI